MAGFLKPLMLEYLDGRRWRITKSFDYRLGAPNGSEMVYIHTNFITDFASIPRGLWNLFPPTGSYGKGAVVHDFLYRFRKIWMIHPFSSSTSRLVDRKEADDIFYEAMQVLGVGRMTRWTIYSALRAGGWVTWNTYRKEE